MRYHLLSLTLFTISVTAVAQAQEAVFLIRHAEQMHDIEDPPLTDAGLNRAKAWATIYLAFDAFIFRLFYFRCCRNQPCTFRRR